MAPVIAQPPPERIETARLLIRPPLPGDGAEANAAIRETFDDLHVWMDWAERIPTVEETESHVRQAHKAFNAGEDFAYFGFLKESGRFVLASGLHPKDQSVPKFEIGYWCRAPFQGLGYVTEAVKALTRVGFEVARATKIEIRC